ncbi:MAG: immunoglobulin domain-containing protein [Bacteroidales bacterium]
MKKLNTLLTLAFFLLTGIAALAQPAAPNPVTATPSAINQGGSSNLNATSAGNQISWYSVATGGTANGTTNSGENYLVFPNATTTYYAESVAPATTQLLVNNTFSSFDPVVYFDLTTGAQPVTVTGFRIKLSSSYNVVYGTLKNWRRSGTYVGNQLSAAALGWVQYISTSVTYIDDPSSTLYFVDFPDFTIPANTTMGMGLEYMGKIIYNTGSSTVSDDKLTVSSGACEGIYSGLYTPEGNAITFNGSVVYTNTNAGPSATRTPVTVTVNSVIHKTWTGAISTDWATAGNWSPSGEPAYDQNVLIPNVTNDPYISTGYGQAADITIESGAVVTIGPGALAFIQGIINNNSGTSGLVLKSTAAGTGSLGCSQNVAATVERYITGSADLAANYFHFVSIPLTTASTSTSNLFNGAYLYDFDVANNTWNGLNTSTVTPLDETKGYMMYTPEASHTYTFTGNLNSGDFSPTLVHAGSGFNLIPNPYSLALNWATNAPVPGQPWIVNTNSWTHTNVADAFYIWPAGGSNYYSWVAGVGVGIAEPKINVGQAFIVKTTGASPVITFTNALRTTTTNPFLKDEAIIPDVLRVRSEANGKADETVVRFTPEATANANNSFDAWKLTGSEDAPQLYTLAADNEKLAINSLPGLSGYAKVPMSFETNFVGDIKLLFSEIESFTNSLAINLEDKLTGQTINLRQQPTYTFAHQPGNTKERFVLHFGNATGIAEPQANNGNIWISDKTVNISSQTAAGEKAIVEIFNAAGQVVFSKQIILSQISQVPTSLTGFAVVKVSSDKNVWIAKGIF